MSNSDQRARAFIGDPKNTKKYLDSLWKELDYGVAYVSCNGSWLAVNSHLCDILEYTESELQQRTFQELTHPDDVNDDVEMSKKLRDGVIDSYKMSKRYITKTSKIVWIKLKVTGIYDDEGNFIHFLSQVSDTLSVQQAEPEKREETKNKFPSVAWIKKEWKWISTTAVLILGFTIDKAADYKNYQKMIEDANKLSQQNRQIIEESDKQQEELKKEIEDLKEKINDSRP